MTTRKKRRHPRARARSLSVHFNGPAGGVTCRVEDISLGGLFIATDQELLPGTSLQLVLLRPGMKKGLHLPAVVANLRPAAPGRQPGLGVRFEGLPSETRSRLLVLLVEQGIANPVEAESDAAGEEPAAIPPPLPAQRGVSGLQVMSLREVESRPPPVQTRGTPAAISFEAVSAQVHQNTEVMSRDEVARHLAQTLGGDWGESAVATAARPPISSIPAAPFVPPVIEAQPGGPSLTDRLQLQIRGLLLQLGEAEQKISTQEQELSVMRERIAELNATVRRKEAEIAQLRRESLR